jgi:hypothetical protein
MWKLVNVKEIPAKTHCPVATKFTHTDFFCLTYIISMACIRNMHSLIGSRTFTLPVHEQRFMFFLAKEVKNGVMDDRIKLVKIKQWQRHDDDNFTVFHFSSKLRKSHGIKN